MLSSCRSFKLLSKQFGSVLFKRNFNSQLVDVKDEVMAALHKGGPVVALESTIITHGMPYPENIKCAVDVENVVRQQGAIPATIAILKGRIKVGLSRDELSELGDVRTSVPIKTSRRDFSYVVSTGLNGGTTVSGTLIVATGVGIPVFATGGLGGVHRDGEKTFDISADLIELGKSPVAVISSGVKSILDIPKTLEYLETQGVLVATFGDDASEFPAFYCRSSGCKSPYNVSSSSAAAKIIQTNRELNLKSGMLFAVPVPFEYAMDQEQLNGAINDALDEARRNGVTGKQITPYLLACVAKITAGKSLETNIALVKNNAKIAADIAVELSRLGGHTNRFYNSGFMQDGAPSTIKTSAGSYAETVIIGGSVVDCCAAVTEKEIKLDGRIHDGRFTVSAGGVARNICEAFVKLGGRTRFISAVGDDSHGKYLSSLLPEECARTVITVPRESTAQCTIVLNRDGECKFIIGDMNIHKRITPELIENNKNLIKTSPLLVLDGNLEISTIDAALKIATENNVPVLYEPTDVIISSKPFETKYWDAVKIITPNLNELRHVASFFGIKAKASNNITEAVVISKALSAKIDVIIVTLGADGLLITRKGLASKPILENDQKIVYSRHYPAEVIENLVNVSGAGDCLVAGLIKGIVTGLNEEESISFGFKAAQASLRTTSAVPKYFNITKKGTNIVKHYSM